MSAPSRRPAPAEAPPEPAVEPGILQLLAHRFGGGLVYLGDESERGVFAQAVRLGLVSSEGYVTPAGYHLLACHGAD